MLTKEKVQELVNHMPETFSVDDLVEKAILLQKIEEAQQQIKNVSFILGKKLKKKWIHCINCSCTMNYQP